MKKIILLSAFTMMLALTGCHSDDAESSSSEIETTVTAPETSSADSAEATTSSSELSLQVTETITPQVETTITESQTAIPTDTPVVVSSAKGTMATEESAPQLETLPEDEAVVEDTGDFGELFS